MNVVTKSPSVKERKQSLNIISANRLTDGIVVYFTGLGWSENIENALVSENKDFLILAANQTISNENLIGLELTIVDPEENNIQPKNMREKIRVTGPTVDYLNINKKS